MLNEEEKKILIHIVENHLQAMIIFTGTKGEDKSKVVILNSILNKLKYD